MMGRIVVFTLLVLATSYYVGSVTHNAMEVQSDTLLASAQDATLQDFATFQSKMSEELNMNAEYLNTKLVHDFYESQIVGNPGTIEPSIATLGDLLLSILCSECCKSNNCDPLLCLNPCPV